MEYLYLFRVSIDTVIALVNVCVCVFVLFLCLRKTPFFYSIDSIMIHCYLFAFRINDIRQRVNVLLQDVKDGT